MNCAGVDCQVERLLAAMTIGDIRDLLAVAGPFLGFLTGWGLFELTERRKVRLAERALREALVAELHHTELLLSSIVGKYAFLASGPDEIKAVAAEIRWFVQVGSSRVQGLGLGGLPEPPAGFTTRPCAS